MLGLPRVSVVSMKPGLTIGVTPDLQPYLDAFDHPLIHRQMKDLLGS